MKLLTAIGPKIHHVVNISALGIFFICMSAYLVFAMIKSVLFKDKASRGFAGFTRRIDKIKPEYEVVWVAKEIKSRRASSGQRQEIHILPAQAFVGSNPTAAMNCICASSGVIVEGTVLSYDFSSSNVLNFSTLGLFIEPSAGFEPTITILQVWCCTNLATRAFELRAGLDPATSYLRDRCSTN